MPILRAFVVCADCMRNENRQKQIMEEYNCDIDEAVRIEWELDCRAIESKLGFESRCVLTLYARLLPKFKTKDIGQIAIHGVYEKTFGKSNCYGIYELELLFDIQKYPKLDEYGRKKLVLDFLMEGLNIIIEEQNWDRAIFDETYNKVLELNFVNEWYWKKKVKSPTKEYSAIVFCEHKIDSFDIYVIISNKKGEEIKRKKVLSVLPDEFIYRIHLGELKWEAENKVSLIDIFGKKKKSVTFKIK